MTTTTQPLPPPAAQIRVGDAERQAAAGELQDHFAAGRLTWEELDERLGHAWAARTGGELSVLFTDLPAPVVAAPPQRRRLRAPSRVDLRVVLFVLLALGLVVATRGFILIPVAWYFFGSRGRRRRRHDRHHSSRGRYADHLAARQ